MSSRPELKLDWCSHDAAKYACAKWHYSGSLPASKTVKIGVWEAGEFIGCIIFSRGSNQWLGQRFGLTQTNCCELTRVALRAHKTPVTRMLAIALRMLKRQSPGMRLVISYADCDENHHGGIYAGGNWLYLGKVQLNGGTPKYRVLGRVKHGRSIHARYGSGTQNVDWLRKHVDPEAEKVFTLGKHKYAWPFDDDMRRMLLPLVKPYPKRAGSIDSDAPVQPGEGGASPTPALHTSSLQASSHGG